MKTRAYLPILQKSQMILRLLMFVLFVLISNYGNSQTCTNIVGGTDFTPIPEHATDYYYHYNFVKQKGPSGNFISTPAALASAATDFSQSKFVYAVTSNPRKLRSDFVNVEDSMMVIKLQTGTNSTLFNYKVSGLKPGSNYTVKVKIYHLPMYDSACHNSYKWQQTNLRMAVNPDQYGNGFNDYSLQSEAASWGKDFTFTINGTLAAADNSINFEIRTGYNFTTCSAIGIADILITGCLNPQIKSSKDKEVCTGEQTLLTLDKEYYANSYTWQKSTNGGSTWTTISTAKSVIDAVTQNSVYRVNVDGTLSSNFAITTITCCIVNGQPSSREVVFHDDFGRFPSSNSYIDAFGNVTNGLTAPFRAPVPYTIPNHQYSTSGPVDDGWYAVSSYMYKNVATWLGAIPEDHSKEPDGGYLIINVNHNFKGIIYDRLITGLCEGKELYFDAFAGNASDAQPPKLILYIKSPDGLTTLAQSPLTTLNAGGGWVRIQVPTFVLAGYTSVRIVIDSQGEGWTSGNDLVLDDIKIMACAPPMLELFSDLPTLTKNKEVCSTTLELGFTPSNLLLNFYGNNPRYLFQWSKTPTVASSWTNLGTPQTVSTYSIPDPKNSTPFAGVPNGGKVYFRVIAATPAVFTSKTNFTAPNYANPDDMCKNYSVSENIEVTLNCPTCKTPADVTITSSDSDTTLCTGQSLTITSNAQANTTDFDFTIYKGSVAPANIVAGPTANISSISRTVAYADAGTYIILVRDKAMPTQTSCQKQASILVKTAPNPTATISEGGSFCQGASVTPVTITLTGTGPFTYTYDPGATVRSNQAGTTYSPTAPTAVGTYNYKVTALQDKYCTAVAADITSTGSIVIKPNPTVTASSNSPVCAGQPLNLTSTADAGSTYSWTGPSSFTSTLQNPSRTGTTTAHSGAYVVTATLNGCTATVTTNATINAIPATPTVTISSPCEGAALNISTATVTGATYAWTTPDGYAPGNVASFSRPSATTAMNGSYSVTVTVSGCTSTAGSATATVNPVPAAPVIPTQTLEYCVGATATALQATALAGHTLQWYTVATGGTASGTAPIPVTTTPGSTTWYVSQKSAAGCEGPRSPITITINANPTLTATATPATICAGLTSAIVATPSGGASPYTYVWSGAGASKLNSTTVANPTYTSLAADPTASNALNVQVTDAKGCKGTAATSVQVNAIPAAPTAGSNAPICEGATLNLTASTITGATYAWTGPSSYTASTQNPTRASATPAMSGTYSVTATVAGCTGPAGTVNVTINAIPAAPTANNPSYCVNSPATPLTATGSNLKWYTVSTGGTALGSAPTPVTTTPGTFNWWVSQTVNGCESARTQVTVTVNNSLSPSITATPSFTECAGTAINISVPGTFNTVAWTGSAATHLSSTSIANPIFSASAPAGTYTATITVTDNNGCSGSATQTITIKAIPATPTVTTTPICAGKTLSVSTGTVAGATYTWTTPDSYNPGSVNAITRANATSAMAGTYSVQVTVNGCQSAPGSGTAVVNANPVITLTPSRPLACKSGNNSTPITMNTTGISGGTSVYSSVPAGVNTSNGTLDPSTAAVGNYTIKLVYTNSNGCVDSTTTTAQIKAIPTVSFGTNPTTMCTYDAPHTMVVNPVAVAPATGTFSGSITTSSFNPATAAVGANPITYTYRDADGCENVANTSITVVSIDPPTVTSGNPKSLVVQVDDTFLPGDNTNLTATGTYTIQWMDGSCTTVNGTGGTYATGKGPLDLGSFTYKVRQRDAVSGCASVCVDALLAITKCPALTPSAIDPYYCVGDATPLTVTATANGPQGAGDKLVWFATSNTAGVPILDNNATYSEAISTASPTTKTVYVAQYNAANTCYSQPKAVTINVVANPTVTLTAPANVCAVAGLVNITTTPAGGTLTGTGATGFNASARTWDPMNGGAPSPTKTLNLTYVVTETHPDGKVCSTTKTVSTTAHFMAPPVPEHKNWLIGDIANIPNNHMTASVSGTGTLIKWYNDQAMTSPRAQAPFATVTNAADKTALTAEIGTPLPQQYTKSYWITQTDAQGCESEPVQVDLVLVNCPFTAPTVVGEEKCVGVALNPITAAKPASMTESVDQWRWYTSSSVTTPTYTGGSSFAHGVSNATAGTTTFYVSYVATETTTSKQCESPRTAVTVVVNPLPTITFDPTNKTLVCYDQGLEQLKVTANHNGNGVGTGLWEVDGATAGITSAGVFDPTFKGQVTGTYPIKYTYTDGKGCVNSATSSIKVQYMPAPTTVGYTWITTQPQPVVISATSLLPTATVKWYTDADVLIPTAGNPFTTSDDPTVEVVKTYKASQVVDGCESPKTPAVVTLTKCPFTAPTVVGEEKCVGVALNPITAAKPASMTESVKEWRWYTSSSATTPVYTSTTSGSYTHGVSNATAGTTTFYVSYVATETVSAKDCESPRTAVSVVVNPLPEITLTVPALVCQDAGDVVLSQTVNYHSNGAGSGTWSVNGASAGITAGGVFKPDFMGEVSGTYTIGYSYTDGKGCTKLETKPIEVQFTPAPTTVGHLSMTIANATVKVEATNLEPMATVQWYSSTNTKLTSPASATQPIFFTGDPGNQVTNKIYRAAQIVKGCESKKTDATVVIIDCPVPAPNVVQPSPICNYDATPEITATVGSPWGSGVRPTPTIPVEFRYYDSPTALTPIASNTTGLYTPIVDKTQANSKTFYVSEYNANIVPQGCEGPRTAVTITVKKVLPASLNPVQDVCAAPEGQNPTFTAYDFTGTVEWHTTTPPTPATTGSVAMGATYQPTFTATGSHTVWAVVRADGCVSEPVSGSYVIKPIPAAPAVTGNAICIGEANKPVSATGSDIKWYQNANRTGFIVFSQNYTPTVTSDNTYTFHATQTVNGCESQTAPATYVIKPLPGLPQIQVSKTQVCVYEQDPEFTATPQSGGTIKWYDGGGTYVKDGTTLSPVRPIGMQYPITIQYFASQVVNGCEGDKIGKSYKINKKPENPIVTGAAVCEGATTIPVLTTNLPQDKWYGDAAATDYRATAISYAPDAAEVGSSSKTYYVVRVLNGCSSDTVPVTLKVIKQPSFSIDSINILRCANEQSQILQAKNLNQNYHTDNTITGEVRWYQGKVTTKGDSFTPDITKLVVGKEGNMIYAQYFVTAQGKTCASEQQSVRYEIRKLPDAAILTKMPICIGEYVNKSDAEVKIPIFARSNYVEWSSSSLFNGNTQYTRNIVLTANQLQELGVGYIPLTVKTIDRDRIECFTILKDSIKVSPMPNSKIIGSDKVCEYAVGEFYSIQQGSAENNYDWNVTGTSVLYSKDMTSGAVRYIDWDKPGIDTITVLVTSPDYCISQDTMVVYVAKTPQPQFDWELPGAMNISEFTNKTIQDSIIDKTPKGTTIAIEVPYTMYWDFGRSYNPEGKVVEYADRKDVVREEYMYGPHQVTLTVENRHGCLNSITKEIFVDIKSGVYFPTAFAPTNPAFGVRYFQPLGYGFKTCEVWIYDTWGNLLWYSDEVEDGIFVGKWDGTYNGELLKSDTYIWKMEATFADGKLWLGQGDNPNRLKKFGSVTLIR